MIINGIDISHWNRVEDFVRVKESGIDFVIIKAGGSDKGFYKDNKFEDYYRLAKLAGLNVGAYYFVGSKFYGADSGYNDAVRFCSIIRDKQFEYPLFVDIEITSTSSKAQSDATDAAIAFCSTMEEYGYYAGIYGSDISGFRERLELERLDKFDKWVARYGNKKPTYVKNYGIWQKSSTGEVPGIIGRVDLDVSYKNYSSIIKKARLNNWR